MSGDALIQGKPPGFIEEDFSVKVALGMSPHYARGRKFCDRPVIDAADGFVDMWNFQDVNSYTWSTATDIDSISSNNVNDTQDILVYGLDANYDDTTQIATLDGQNRVALATPLNHCYRLQNANGTDLLGEVFVYPNTALTTGKPTDVSKVRAYIAIGDGQTLMSQYRVPAGKTMMIGYFSSSLTKAQAITSIMNGYVRPFGGVKLITVRWSVGSQGSSQYAEWSRYPFVIPEKSDIMFEANSSGNGAGISLSYQFLLVDNAYLANQKA